MRNSDQDGIGSRWVWLHHFQPVGDGWWTYDDGGLLGMPATRHHKKNKQLLYVWRPANEMAPIRSGSGFPLVDGERPLPKVLFSVSDASSSLATSSPGTLVQEKWKLVPARVVGTPANPVLAPFQGRPASRLTPPPCFSPWWVDGNALEVLKA